jgi:uncharacterized membrane protein YdjX (TVP38/TMEM64 family)
LRLRTYLPGLLVLAALIAVGFTVESGVLSGLLSEDWIDREVRGRGITGGLLFVAAGALATALAVPRNVVSFLGGYAFGLVQGTLLALLAEGIGCVLTFCCARTFARRLVSERLGERVRHIEDFLAANPFSMTLLVRLIPVGNNFVTNMAAGVSRVRALPFLLGSLLGYLPKTFVFALAGSGIDTGAHLRVVLAVVVFLISGALGVWLYRRFRHGKTLGDDVDKAL